VSGFKLAKYSLAVKTTLRGDMMNHFVINGILYQHSKITL
jgi:hypothetical protein